MMVLKENPNNYLVFHVDSPILGFSQLRRTGNIMLHSKLSDCHCPCAYQLASGDQPCSNLTAKYTVWKLRKDLFFFKGFFSEVLSQ